MRGVGSDGASPSQLPPKAWWQSRTIIGIAVMLISQVLKVWKVDLLDQELSDVITFLLDTVGAGLAIYGRIHARRALTMTVPGGAFNSQAEVRRAQKIGNRKSEIGNPKNGRADLDALVLVVVIFCLGGLAWCGVDWTPQRYGKDGKDGRYVAGVISQTVPADEGKKFSWWPHITPGWPLRPGRWLIKWEGSF